MRKDITVRGTVSVSDGMLRRAIAEDNLAMQFKDLMSTPCFTSSTELRTRVVEDIRANSEVVVLEFGVWQGRSMEFWSSRFTNPASRFYGFDSFEGLPEDWNKKHPKGTFSTAGKIPSTQDSRVRYCAGWIQNTLPDFVKEHDLSGKTVLCHIDVDLYSATLFVLGFLWSKIDRMYLVFDEFEIDENRAFSDFQSAFPISVNWKGHTIAGNGLPGVVFCEIARIPYAVEG
ncbi:MAG: TylF/MycF/NovP-related O-methyltransferase [Pseudomonadota bacterium]